MVYEKFDTGAYRLLLLCQHSCSWGNRGPYVIAETLVTAVVKAAKKFPKNLFSPIHNFYSISAAECKLSRKHLYLKKKVSG